VTATRRPLSVTLSRMRNTSRLCLLAGVLVAVTTVIAQENVNLDVVHRIRAEALQNSKVMDHLFYLTDVNGPRLTNSPGTSKRRTGSSGR